MNAQQFCDEARAALLPLADPQRAIGMSAYMKNHFDFLGIASPVRRIATRELLATASTMSSEQLSEIASVFWCMPHREYQYVAVDLLSRYHKRLDVDAIDAMLTLAQRKSWWDSVDGLAGVVGDVIRRHLASDRHIQAGMDGALKHQNLWVQRVAMLHQLGWRGATDSDRLFYYATVLAPHRDFFIRKAVGWALRDFARHDPDGVRTFLQEKKEILSPLSAREASKHL